MTRDEAKRSIYVSLVRVIRTFDMRVVLRRGEKTIAASAQKVGGAKGEEEEVGFIEEEEEKS